MCLQWCHVTEQIVNNDYPCFFCPPEIRLAMSAETCGTCSHRCGERCQLTGQNTPHSEFCCHFEVIPQHGLRALTEKSVHPALMQVHQVETIEQLFWAVETAPEPQVTTGGVVLVSIEELAVPWVYGLPSYAWPGEFPQRKPNPSPVHRGSRRIQIHAPIQISRGHFRNWTEHGKTYKLPSS